MDPNANQPVQQVQNQVPPSIPQQTIQTPPVNPPKSSNKLLLIIGVLVVLFLVSAGGYAVLQSQLPKPTPTPTYSNYPSINSLEDAVKNAGLVTDLQLCNKSLVNISSTIGELTKVEYIDLSENNLTTLPNEISKLTSLKELILVDNNFSASEQTRIRQLLPNAKVAFTPQKNFDPYISDLWKMYSSTKYGFSFKYHPDLKITENENGISIANDLPGLKRAFASCSVEKAYISLSITPEDNPSNLTPVQYLENKWQIRIIQNGNTYSIDKLEAERKMLGPIKAYRNGDIDGLIYDAGESEQPRIITSRNQKLYTFQYFPGGETGSSIPDIAKKVLDQSLATFKFTQ